MHTSFWYGCKLQKLRLDKLYEKTGDELLAGNIDGTGASDNVLHKIGSESHQTGRLDKELYTGLTEAKG